MIRDILAGIISIAVAAFVAATIIGIIELFAKNSEPIESYQIPPRMQLQLVNDLAIDYVAKKYPIETIQRRAIVVSPQELISILTGFGCASIEKNRRLPDIQKKELTVLENNYATRPMVRSD